MTKQETKERLTQLLEALDALPEDIDILTPDASVSTAADAPRLLLYQGFDSVCRKFGLTEEACYADGHPQEVWRRVWLGPVCVEQITRKAAPGEEAPEAAAMGKEYRPYCSK